MNMDNLVNDESRQKKITSKQWAIIGVIATVVMALGIGIGIYNKPENRLNRQLSLGQKYLESQQYEEAILAFNQAIAIDDRCLEAYVGGIKAYLQTENKEELLVFYNRALEASRSLEGENLNLNMEYVISIYLSAKDIYNDDLSKIIEVLEDGLAVTNGDTKIKQQLINNYLTLAGQHLEAKEYQESLKVYDRLLKLDKANKQILSDLENCLTKYIEELITEKNFAEAKSLIEKYKGYALAIDFDAILARITELEKIEAENAAFMQKVYDLMAAEDYKGMLEIYGLEETKAFLERMTDSFYVYIPNKELSNIGVGIYTDVSYYENVDYYFYYGNYQNEQRIGNGISYVKHFDGYRVFEGEWVDNIPNGYGEEFYLYYRNENFDTVWGTSLKSGNLKNGLWDGEVNMHDETHNRIYNFSYVAIDGVPTEDKTNAAIAEIPYHTREVGEYVYAYGGAGDGTYSVHHIGYGCAFGTIGFSKDKN